MKTTLENLDQRKTALEERSHSRQRWACFVNCITCPCWVIPGLTTFFFDRLEQCFCLSDKELPQSKGAIYLSWRSVRLLNSNPSPEEKRSHFLTPQERGEMADIEQTISTRDLLQSVSTMTLAGCESPNSSDRSRTGVDLLAISPPSSGRSDDKSPQ